MYKAIAKKMQTRREFRAKLSDELRYVDEFLKTNLDSFNYKELKSKIREAENKHFLKEYPKLELKIKEARNVLIELKHEENLSRLKEIKFSIEDEIKELKLEKERLQRLDAEKERKIKDKLCLYENYVFEKSKLNEEEIKVLLKEKYQQINQYCVKQQRVITAFVKPPLNHSVTHAFLVWSVRKLLEEFKGVEDIEEHETREADITFEANGKRFAIEVETGNLLSKTEQRENKIKYLNEWYENRWLIVVSHRSLVKKYKKFGNCTQRNGVSKKLGKMIQI